MIFLGTPQLRGGVNIFFFYKVSLEKHPSVHIATTQPIKVLVWKSTFWNTLGKIHAIVSNASLRQHEKSINLRKHMTRFKA